MLELEHKTSNLCINGNLGIFDAPSTQFSIEKIAEQHYYPIATICQGGDIS